MTASPTQLGARTRIRRMSFGGGMNRPFLVRDPKRRRTWGGTGWGALGDGVSRVPVPLNPQLDAVSPRAAARYFCQASSGSTRAATFRTQRGKSPCQIWPRRAQSLAVVTRA